MKSSNSKLVPCRLAHALLNRLSVIVGNCDLASEKVQEGSELATRLSDIRKAAQSMANELKGHQCELTTSQRSSLEKVEVGRPFQ